MRAGYVQPGPPEALDRLARRSPGRYRWVFGAAMLAPLLGLAAAFRLVTTADPAEVAAGTDMSGLPGGFGWVQVGIGVLVAVGGTAVYVRAQPVRPGPAADLPKQVRRAVRRRGAVPERYRDRVPAWLDRMRGYGVTGAGQMVSVCGTMLIVNAGNDPSWNSVLRDVVVFGGSYLVLAGVPLAGYLWWLERLRRGAGARRRA